MDNRRSVLSSSYARAPCVVMDHVEERAYAIPGFLFCGQQRALVQSQRSLVGGYGFLVVEYSVKRGVRS